MDSNGNFEPGDLVYLKSGSARLTVTAIHPRPDTHNALFVNVMWMHYETQTLREAMVPVAALEPVERTRTAEPTYRQYDRRIHTRDEVPF